MAAAVAPWMLGAGLLVSFTASAGYEPPGGRTVLAALAARAVPPLPEGAVLVPALGAEMLAAPPRSELKPRARTFPSVDRSLKGDPIVALRTTLSRRVSSVRAGAGWALASSDLGVAGLFVPGPAAVAPDLEAEAAFVVWPTENLTTTDAASAEASPRAPATDPTGTGPTNRSLDGSTPAISRAVALASATPAPAEATPVEVAATALGVAPTRPSPATTALARAEPEPTERSRYADLIAPASLEREQRCLAEAVYFEARSESEDGQAAVAQVVLNRVKSGLYPANVCGVVYQNRHRYLGCQFSFACEGKSLRVTDPTSWATATRVAKNVVEGRTYLADVGGATHYHADYVKPGWSRRLRRMDVIGRHIFYQLKAGQT